jgi:hypothetical protein
MMTVEASDVRKKLLVGRVLVILVGREFVAVESGLVFVPLLIVALVLVPLLIVALVLVPLLIVDVVTKKGALM